MSTILKDALYKTAETSLNKDDNKKQFLRIIDKHMANNATIYAASGPGIRPAFTTRESEEMMAAVGIDPAKISETIEVLSKTDNRLKIQGLDKYPFLISDAMGLRYASIKDDKKMISAGISYFIVFNYPLLHYKYFKKCNPTPSIMNYVINNLSNKFKLKQFGNLWGALYDIVNGAYVLHRKNMEKGEDDAFVRFLTDARTRLNGFMRQISNEYYEAFNTGKYLGTESESFDEESYHEADSNALQVKQITDRIVTKLITVGPNKTLIQTAASACKISQTKLKSHIMTMITNDHINDIHTIVENLLFMYLMSTDEKHSIDQVYTNDFMVYCLRVYKKSHTIDKNVNEIKKILDRWLIELGVTKKGAKPTTFINNYRKALYMFFVMSVVDIK